MDTNERISELEEQIATMDQQLESISAELLGFKLAFIRLAAFLSIAERDVTAAREAALAQAEDETESAGMSHESTLIVFSTLQKTMALAGAAWRHTGDSPETPRG